MLAPRVGFTFSCTWVSHYLYYGLGKCPTLLFYNSFIGMSEAQNHNPMKRVIIAVFFIFCTLFLHAQNEDYGLQEESNKFNPVLTLQFGTWLGVLLFWLIIFSSIYLTFLYAKTTKEYSVKLFKNRPFSSFINIIAIILMGLISATIVVAIINMFTKISEYKILTLIEYLIPIYSTAFYLGTKGNKIPEK